MANRAASALPPSMRYMFPRDRGTSENYELVLRVWAQGGVVNLIAWIATPSGGDWPNVEVIKKASWLPSETTAISVADWGRRALSSWLAEQLLPGADQ